MPKKIDKSLLDNIGKPRDMIDNLLNNQIDQVESELGTQFRGIGNKILSLFIQNGNRVQLSPADVSDKIGNTINEDEICTVLDKLTSTGLLRFSGDNTYEIANNVLAQRANQKLEGVNLLMRRMELMVRNRIERDVLLDEDDLSYLETYLNLLDLTKEEREFVDRSYASVRKKKRRLAFLITLAFLLLTTLAVWALFNESRVTKLNADLSNSLDRLRTDSIKLENTNSALKRARDTLAAANIELDTLLANAEYLRREAESNQRNEFLSRQKADAAAERARAAETRATQLAKEATDAAERAVSKQAEAEQARREADEAKSLEEIARRRAENFNQVVISRNVANRALQVEDERLKALLALQTYQINEDLPEVGDVQDPNIMRALYNAAIAMDKRLELSIANVHLGSVRDIVFHPEKDVFYTAGSDGQVYEWAIRRWNRIGAPEVSPTDFSGLDNGAIQNDLAINISGSRLLVSGELPFVQMLNTDQRFVSGYFVTGNTMEVFQSGFLAGDDAIIAFGRDTAYITQIDEIGRALPKKASKVNRIFTIAGNPLPISFYGEKSTTVDDREEYTLNFELYQNGNFITKNLVIPQADFSGLTAVEHQQDQVQGYVAFGFEDGKILLFKWDISDFSILSEYLIFNQHLAPISNFAFSNNGQYLGVASLDGTVSVWDLERYQDPSYLPMIFDIHDGWALSLTFSRDDRFLLVGDQAGSLTFWNLNPSDYAEKLCQDLRALSNDPRDLRIDRPNWQRFFGTSLQQRNICR